MEEMDFVKEMRTKTRRQHDMSTVAVNWAAPLALSSPRVYRLLLTAFYWVFKAIESELETRRRMHPKITPIYFRELLRTAAFEKDLQYYYGHDFAEQIGSPSEATAAYVRELKECVAADPILLIAYCHSMYIGLCTGGQISKKWIRTAFGLPKGVGTAIFEFDEIKDLMALKKSYEEALNSIALSQEEKDRIIERKRRVFECNDMIFEELRRSRTYWRRVWRVIFVFAAICFAILVLVPLAKRTFL